jgi:hypothetical protein
MAGTLIQNLSLLAHKKHKGIAGIRMIRLVKETDSSNARFEPQKCMV